MLNIFFSYHREIFICIMITLAIMILNNYRTWMRFNNIPDSMTIRRTRRVLVYRSAMVFIGVIILLTFAIAASAAEKITPGSLQSVERECFAAYAQAWRSEHGFPCGSCEAGWPDVARCAAARVMPQVRLSKLDSCIASTATKYSKAHGSTDLVTPALTCAAR